MSLKIFLKFYLIDNCQDDFTLKIFLCSIGMLTYISLKKIGKDNSLRKIEIVWTAFEDPTMSSALESYVNRILYIA